MLQIMMIVVIAVVIYVLLTQQNKKHEYKYDERQVLARNTAYKYSGFAMIVAAFAGGFLFEDAVISSVYAPAYISGICYLGVAVYMIVSIMKDAFFYPRQNPVSYIAFITVLIVISFISMVTGNIEGFGNMFVNSVPLNLYNILVFGIVDIAFIVKVVKDKREGEE